MATMDKEQKIKLLADAAVRLRMNSVLATNASKSGHPSSCASCADLIAALFLDEMRFFPMRMRQPQCDRFILSKGHAAPVLYAAMSEVGFYDEEELLDLRKLSSNLEGHPTPRLPFVDVATGSLGQGLSNAVGMAYVGKYIDKMNYRVYCLLGDGEVAEGSVWEAMSFASFYRLDNLVAIIDCNRLGQSQATQLGHDTSVYEARVQSFGWKAIVIDGHNFEQILAAFDQARSTPQQPTCIIAKTFKGHDLLDLANADNWHGKPVGDKLEAIMSHLRSKLMTPPTRLTLKPRQPEIDNCLELQLIGHTKLPSPPAYQLGQQVATRAAYGTALQRLGSANPRVLGLDGDTKNSTFSIKLLEAKPDQFVECFIAEQNLAGVAMGAGCRERVIPFASTFAAFFSRAFDQIRMGAVSQSNCNFVGSHAGVSIGEDGPSQMALEDLAMFGSVTGTTVFYPSDAVSCERAVELAANTPGMCFIRTGRPADPVIYDNEEPFQVGQAKVVRSSEEDKVTVIGAGVTLHEALKAADQLKAKGVSVRVVDPFTIKPLDARTVCEAVRATGGRVVTVEDHQPHGGLGSAVAVCLCTNGVASVRQKLLAVRHVPRSGKPGELMHLYEIDADAIRAAVEQLL